MAYIGLEIATPRGAPLSLYPGAQLHMTLAHFPKPSLEASLELAAQVFESKMLFLPPSIISKGIETWDRVGEVLVCEQRPGLTALREEVLRLLDQVGIKPSSEHVFNPHITLGRASRLVFDNPCIFFAPVALELAGTVAVTRYRFPFLELGIGSA